MRRERAAAYAVGFGAGILLDLIVFIAGLDLVLGAIDIVSFVR